MIWKYSVNGYSKTASNGSNFTSINNFAFFLLATIVLAGINDVDGIIIGGVLGHTICTGLAVIAGALISRKISVRAVTFIGAIGKAFSKYLNHTEYQD